MCTSVNGDIFFTLLVDGGEAIRGKPPCVNEGTLFFGSLLLAPPAQMN